MLKRWTVFRQILVKVLIFTCIVMEKCLFSQNVFFPQKLYDRFDKNFYILTIRYTESKDSYPRTGKINDSLGIQHFFFLFLFCLVFLIEFEWGFCPNLVVF